MKIKRLELYALTSGLFLNTSTMLLLNRLTVGNLGIVWFDVVGATLWFQLDVVIIYVVRIPSYVFGLTPSNQTSKCKR